MKIAFEAQRIFRAKKHGMDFVALELMKQLQAIDTKNHYYVLVRPGEDRTLFSSSNVDVIELDCPTYPLWEQVALPFALKKIKPDLLHCTSNTAPVCGSVPLVLTLHDIIFLEKRGEANPSLYQNLGRYYRRWVVPRLLNQCSKIITVSQFERDRIAATLNLDSHKITYIYNGVGEHFQPMEHPGEVTRNYIQDPRYIFYLGNTDPKKNVLGTLRAYDRYLEKSSQKLPLLIADLDSPVVESLLRKNDLMRIQPHLRFAGYIPNKDLPSIYGGADLFLYPSLRESFGIPILEAMACGTPVITSDTSSMPEVSGGASLLVDPFNPDDIAAKIIILESDSMRRQQLVQSGFERAKEFTWQKSAERLMALYSEVLPK